MTRMTGTTAIYNYLEQSFLSQNTFNMVKNYSGNTFTWLKNYSGPQRIFALYRLNLPIFTLLEIETDILKMLVFKIYALILCFIILK